MESATQSRALRRQLEYRHRRLQELARDSGSSAAVADLMTLISDVDSALNRLEVGTYGICDQCLEPVEPDYLRAYPLAKVCLSHLSEQEQRTVERDLELASRVQAQLLPALDLELNGYAFAYRYEPLGPVSGDYCDVVRHSDGSAYFFLGDVTGKGVSASLLMTQLHAIFHSLVSLDLPVSELVQRANRIFSESTLSTHFATLVCGRLSPDGQVDLVNAGHCPPVVVRRGLTTTIGPSGFPLGLVKDTEYRTTQFFLVPGDLLFLYTDGLTEARNPGDEEYDESRVLSLLRTVESVTPLDVLAASAADHTTFLNGQPRLDDLTILTIVRT
jgi:sigma-B regulation protein RsbU (phosphoserine phosphatase)